MAFVSSKNGETYPEFLLWSIIVTVNVFNCYEEFVFIVAVWLGYGPVFW
jgi:hypothetical protein